MKAAELNAIEVAVTRTEKRYVLNEGVFELNSCPDWAQWAAVNKNGTVYLYRDKPRCSDTDWLGTSIHMLPVQLDAPFDATDWQNSLIRRPERKVLEVTMADIEKKYGRKVKIVKDL